MSQCLKISNKPTCSAGEEHSAVPSSAGRAAQTDPLLHHLHDLGAQAAQVPAATLRQTQRDLRGHGHWREQGTFCRARHNMKGLSSSILC